MNGEPVPSLTEISEMRQDARRCGQCGRDRWNDSELCNQCQPAQRGTSSPKILPESAQTVRTLMRPDYEWGGV